MRREWTGAVKCRASQNNHSTELFKGLHRREPSPGLLGSKQGWSHTEAGAGASPGQRAYDLVLGSKSVEAVPRASGRPSVVLRGDYGLASGPPICRSGGSGGGGGIVQGGDRRVAGGGLGVDSGVRAASAAGGESAGCCIRGTTYGSGCTLGWRILLRARG